jgi:hypothetical protein
MLIALFKSKKRCQRGICAVAVLALSMVGWFFPPANAEEECATDFFSQKTCRSFDTLDPSTGQNSEAQESIAEAALWDDHSGLSGSQIWYRNPLDGNWMSMALRSQEALGNRAIHGFRCLTDLFGNVVCNQDQLIPDVLLDEKSPEQQ